MGLLFWKKEAETSAPGYAPYEEINAKRTSVLGYFFLILMVIFGVWQGNNFLSALEETIPRPAQNSSCLSVMDRYLDQDSVGYYYDDYYYYTDPNESPCRFSEREMALSLHILYQNVALDLTAHRKAKAQINKINSAIADAENSRGAFITDYQASLLEDIAGKVNPVLNQGNIQNQIVSQDEYINRLSQSLATETAKERRLYQSILNALTPHAVTIEKANAQYRHEMIVHQFIQFLVSLLFVAPLFIFLWLRYHASKKVRSEYALIWGGLVATSGLLLAEILLLFIYEVLPRRILEEIFEFLAQFEFIWTLLYWLGFVLIPLFFGFLIYLIQKKFYNKQAVMMRALKNERCPGCSFKIQPGMNHCPVCGYKLKEHCASCGAMTMRGGSFCSNCGQNPLKENPETT